MVGTLRQQVHLAVMRHDRFQREGNFLFHQFLPEEIAGDRGEIRIHRHRAEFQPVVGESQLLGGLAESGGVEEFGILEK